MITLDDVANLRSLLARARNEGIGRAEVYLEYYRLLEQIPGTEAARDQILIQTYITTFSGAIGGAAILGNAIAKFSDPENYTISLTEFSEDIIEGLINAIARDIADGNDGALTANEIQRADSGVWNERNLGQYFLGNIQLIDEGPAPLFSAGNLASALAGYQLLFGAQVGFEVEDYPGAIWDRSHPDYDVLRDQNGRILYIEDKIGAGDRLFPGILEEAPGATLTLGAVLAQTLGLQVFGNSFLFLQGILGLILFRNEALREGAATLIGDIRDNFFTGAETDRELRSLLEVYTGINGNEFQRVQELPDELFFDDFPLVLRNSGSFEDPAGSHIIFAYDAAEIFAGAGEDLLVGFNESVIFGDAGEDFLFGRDNAILDGGAANDLLGGVGFSDLRGGAGNDFLIGSQGAQLNGGAGFDILIHALGFGSVQGGAGNDILLGIAPRFVEAGEPLIPGLVFNDPNVPNESDQNQHLELEGGVGNDVIAVFGGVLPPYNWAM